jgi:hypothetical protein
MVETANTISAITNRDLAFGHDGSFRFTAGPSPSDQLATEPGKVNILVRDVLADWSQRPARLGIRRLDDAASPAGPELRKRVLARLSPFVRFWSSYHVGWQGGLQPNSYSGPSARAGDWGYLVGARFKLAPDDALLVIISTAGAGYAGFQLTDPWMVSPDARRYQASLNLSQMTPDDDGAYTFAVTPTDPGVANWIDSAGLNEGFLVLRWQNTPADANKDELLRNFRLTTLDEAAGLPGVARVTPQQREEQLAARAAAYAIRAAEPR